MPKPIALRAVSMQDHTVTVDRESGMVSNVAIITGGTTRTSGNGVAPFDVDAITLQAIAAAINATGKGVKSRVTHPELTDSDDLPYRVGYVLNARVVGNQVRGDVKFHNPDDADARRIMAIAEDDPSSCGISVVSLDATLEPSQTPTGLVMRCSTVEAADWVGTPAANPAGMLSAAPAQTESQTMTPEQRAYLEENGLSPEATEEEAVAYVEALNEEEKAAFDAMAESAEPVALADDEVPAAEVATEEADDEEEPKPTALSAAPDNEKAIALAAKQERTRIKEIGMIALRCGYENAWEKKQIDSETPIGEVRRIALASLNRDPNAMPNSKSTVSVGADRNIDTIGDAIRDAIMLRANPGRRFVQFEQGGGVMLSAQGAVQTRQAHDRSGEFRHHSVLEMGRRYLIALGFREADGMSKQELSGVLLSKAKLAKALPGVFMTQGTGDFSSLLADSMGKVLRAEYALAPTTWQQWCRKSTASDFKDIKKMQLSEAADLVLTPEGDDIEYGTLTDSKETYALSTYSKGIKLTRQALINDDLSAFDRIPSMMGRAAARKVESLAIAILTVNAAMSDNIALFAAGHNNVTTGALSVTSLGAARTAMRRQTALGSDDPLELTPRFLLVPETLRTEAEQLIGSVVDPSKNNAAANPFANNMTVIPSARLDMDSTTQWYIAADSAEIDTVEVTTLEGQDVPLVEEEQEFDSSCAKVKVTHDVASKAIDFRGLVRSSGS